jgi:hypothetical protein
MAATRFRRLQWCTCPSPTAVTLCSLTQRGAALKRRRTSALCHSFVKGRNRWRPSSTLPSSEVSLFTLRLYNNPCEPGVRLRAREVYGSVTDQREIQQKLFLVNERKFDVPLPGSKLTTSKCHASSRSCNIGQSAAVKICTVVLWVTSLCDLVCGFQSTFRRNLLLPSSG